MPAADIAAAMCRARYIGFCTRKGLSPQELAALFAAITLSWQHVTRLLNRERGASAPSFWKFSYYQSLFDVTTNDVLRRLLWSAVPQFSSPSYLEKHIRPNPDLYGASTSDV
ncbi:hypothetical protein HPB49_004844 [Dermacentor silvarum]|uniref:Uncharacterized protein n=1 Tax=Dermacentor silvarum TaxID=543639 RepID=A0ACB8DI37_DERSI|nr:hypothetical protein HPB49_004844 [Dermacentor silvarum]